MSFVKRLMASGPICFENADGFRLTLLHLQKKSWNAANNLSRKGVLNKLCDLSGITKDYLLRISETEYEQAQCSVIGNALSLIHI